MIIIATVGLILLAFLGIPIAWALGISSIAAIQVGGVADFSIVAQKLIAGMDSFSLMAIPFFILAGNLMSGGGLTQRLLAIARTLVGWIRGSVSIISIVASMFFGAITGSAVATASSIGGMCIPEMIKEGYDKSYAAAVTTGAAICGPLIPPSIGLIVYASSTNVPVSDLFKGTLLPGILYGLLLCVVAVVIANKRQYVKHPRASLKEILASLKNGFWALLMPVIVLGSIFSGLTSPTEASVISVMYGLIVGMFIHKDLKFKDLKKIFLDSAMSTGIMFVVIGMSGTIGWLVAISNVSTTIANALITSGSSKILVILFIMIFGLILGCIMDVVAAILISTPVLYPMAEMIGYSGAEFGVIIITLLTLGHITPPVGASLLLSNDIAGANISKTIKEAVPFFLVGLSVVILLWIFPQIISILI